MENKNNNVKKLVFIAMFGALAAVLMLIEIPLVLIAPSFYKLDFSEIPVLIGSFSIGPVAGIMIELLKNILKLIIKPTTTGFVGEFANFTVGCAFVVPAGIIYKMHKTKKTAIIGMGVGTLTMAIVGVVVNALVMLPFYSHVMPIDAIIAAGAAVNKHVNSFWSFALICVGPFNIIKGVLVSFVTLHVYKRVSRMIHNAMK